MLARYLSLAVFLLLVVTASFIGSGFEAGEWFYFALKQPSWAPPYWLIGPLWAIVYAMMALAAWVVWLTGHYSRTGALLWWGLILVLNSGWSALFFGMNRPGWALPVLGLAIGVAIFCIHAFGRLSRQAALLMVPYLLWVIFLALYNLSVWTLSGGFLERFLG